MARQKASAPDKPFFCYFAPAAVHAPHHVAPEWIDRFKGQFDEGWDALRERTFERQLATGIILEGTRLTPRPDQIPSWDDYPDRYKPVARRLMEVFAGFLAHTDAQVLRVIEALEDLGCFEDTLVIYLTVTMGHLQREPFMAHGALPRFRMESMKIPSGCLSIWMTSALIAVKTISM